MHHRDFRVGAEALEEGVALFLDQGNKFYNQTTRLYGRATQNPTTREKWKISGIYFGSRKVLLPLQAADYLAYEVFKYSLNEMEGVLRPERKSFAALCHGKFDGRFYDAKLLERWKALFASQPY